MREEAKQCLKKSQEFEKIASKYEDKYEELYLQQKSRVVRYEYAKGGLMLHRGYYCPSPIEDIVIGNTKRGRLIKEKSRNNANYQYGYDEQDRIIMIIIKDDDMVENEMIIEDGNTTYGLLYDTMNQLSQITICEYEDGKIVKYTEASYCSYFKVSEYREQKFMYDNGQLHKAQILEFSRFSPKVQKYVYIFEHDENGYLSKYTDIEYDSYDNNKKRNSGEYKVYLKRRV